MNGWTTTHDTREKARILFFFSFQNRIVEEERKKEQRGAVLLRDRSTIVWKQGKPGCATSIYPRAPNDK